MLFPPHTYFYEAYECGVGACWKSPKPPKPARPLRPIVRMMSPSHSFMPIECPSQSANQNPRERSANGAPETTLSQAPHACRSPFKTTTRDPCMHSACPHSQCVPNPSYRCTPRNEAAVQGFGVQKGSRIPTPPTGCLCGKPHCPRTGQQEKGQQAKAERSRLPIGRPSGRYAHRRGVLPLAARKARQKARLLIGRRDARDEAMACFWTFCVG